MDNLSHLEIERKYDVGDGIRVPALGGDAGVATVGESQTIDLDAEYYDTASAALAGAGIALRRRVGGADQGWHIKRNVDHGRLEQQWPLDEPGDGVPGAILAELGEVLSGEALVPVARIANRRQVVTLFDASGARLAELCDDRVDAADLRDGRKRKWREWEVELLDGAPEDFAAKSRLLDDIERVLAAAGAQPSTSSSKLARALGVER